ncbi:GIY-YIG nuclease family protein [Sphingobacterium yanglingense]|uniref:Putative endonuclease n=1 Tax=Sphingobacterium yanglingense TaxID=1437280 RepID=A0A4R6WLN7_9SPHI|nr:GIY-YIG nuclease family protein [Sphingobacterium yanglingense]TDQ79708.1 putative endonuclease [Sphingobacterium yanglingense]
MKKHLIYIATDPNRAYVEAGYTQDLIAQSSNLQFHAIRSTGTFPKFNRIVHVEEFTSFDSAQKRLIELSHFTRMQKERLIRKHNPNWLNITSPGTALNSHPALRVAHSLGAAC